MPEKTDAAQKAQTDNPNYDAPTNRPPVVADTVQGPSLLTRLAQTLYPPLVGGADSDGVPNPTPWEGHEGANPDSYGVDWPTTPVEAPAEPDIPQLDRLPMVEAAPIIPQASMGGNVGVYAMTNSAVPQRLCDNRPDRRIVRLRRRADAGNVYIGFNEGAAASGAAAGTAMLLVASAEVELPYSGALYATADAACTIEVVEVFNAQRFR